MSTEPSGNQRSATPLSGRATPVNRLRGQQTEDDVNSKDKAVRRYAAGIDRVLSSFETTQQDWADYISFLSRLQKVLQARPEGSHSVPHADNIATRLAQCLNPALPSGVHQKALEVYSNVFSIYQPEVLTQRLRVFLPGLSPVLSFASLSVRPYFLSILEDHVFPLGASALRPAMKALILSLLPGLEDESSEDFDRVLSTLDRLRGGQSPGQRDGSQSFFWQCFFLATLSSPSRRQGALAFLVRKLPRLGTSVTVPAAADNSASATTEATEEARAVITPEPGLLIRCFAAGLSDKQVLVQRGFLDLLVTHLPLHASVLQKAITATDLERLLSAATTVVLRRDMSLNRRLWRWLLGPEPKEAPKPTDGVKSPTDDQSASESAYLSRYGREALTKCILSMIQTKSDDVLARARPFRICLSLMDRWEVGGLIIPSIFGPAMESVYTYCLHMEKYKVDDLIKSVGIFFDGIESSLIWSKMLQLLGDSVADNGVLLEKRLMNLRICVFITQRFNLREEEMTELHIPLVVLASLSSLRMRLSSGRGKHALKPEVVLLVIENLERLTLLIDMKSAKFTEPAPTDILDDIIDGDQSVTLLSSISNFYRDEQQGVEGVQPPLDPTMLYTTLLMQSLALFLELLKQEEYEQCLPLLARVHSNISQRIPQSFGKLADKMFAIKEVFLLKISEYISNSKGQPHGLSFPTLSAVVQCLIGVKATMKEVTADEDEKVSSLVHNLAELLWLQLDPLQPKFHIEVVQCMYMLINGQLSGSPVESAIAMQILEAFVLDEKSSDSSQLPSTARGSLSQMYTGKKTSHVVNTLRRYHLLWTHYPPERQAGQPRKMKAMQRRASAMSTLVGSSEGPITMPNILAQPLLLILDEINGATAGHSSAISVWLQSIPDLARVYNYLITQVMQLKCIPHHTSGNPGITKGYGHNSAPSNELQVIPEFNHESTLLSQAAQDDHDCAYFLGHILNLLRLGMDGTWAALCAEASEPFEDDGALDSAQSISLQIAIARICTQLLPKAISDKTMQSKRSPLQNDALEILILLLQGPVAVQLLPLRLDEVFIGILHSIIGAASPHFEQILLRATTLAVRIKEVSRTDALSESAAALPSSPDRLMLDTRNQARVIVSRPSPLLIDCLKKGFSTPGSYVILDDWVDFLTAMLPLFAAAIIESLIPLVETFCKQSKIVYRQLSLSFSTLGASSEAVPETTLISIVNGLERILASAHERLVNEEQQLQDVKTPEQTQSFFGSMVQGVFAADATINIRSSTANSRLTVILCFQDTVRACYEIWTWGLDPQTAQDTASSASFAYTSLRVRNRVRRLLEHLFAAEALECLEALVVLWRKQSYESTQPSSIIALLNVLSGAKPKHTFPAIFNALYSRINSSTLENSRVSSLTSELTDVDLIRFLVAYTQSVDDDAIDEVWPNCLLFLKDVLANPLPHRQILPSLLYLLTEIAEKVDRTNFGEQKRMRKELADNFLRVLTATFTTRPQGLIADQATPINGSKRPSAVTRDAPGNQPFEILPILVSVVQRLPIVVVESERMVGAVQSIFTNAITPAIRAKSFPASVSADHLDLLLSITKLAQASKVWRKDINDAVNDSKFFLTSPLLLERYWLPIIRQLSSAEKERFTELLARLSPPTTAGIVFGVGASSARTEADRKAQLNLRRLAITILASPNDTFVTHLGALEDKLVELFTATNVSSPSVNTWAEAFLVLRVLMLKMSPIHVAPLWPLINKELQSALLSVVDPDGEGHTKYNNAALLQACKLLDTLAALGMEDFQIYEWLYVTDTIDAVYRPANIEAVSLTDELADVLNTAADPASASATVALNSSMTPDAPDRKYVPLFDTVLESLSEEYDAGDLRSMPKQELAVRVLRPYFGQLSLLTFEATYACRTVDVDECISSVVKDLYDGYASLDG